MTAVASISSAGSTPVVPGNLPAAPASLAALAANLMEGAVGASVEFPALLDDLMQQEPGSNKPESNDSGNQKTEHKKEEKNESGLLCLPVAVAEVPALPVIPDALPPSAPVAGVPETAIGGDSSTVPLPDAAQTAPPEREPNGEARVLPDARPNETSTAKELEIRAIAGPDVRPFVSIVPQPLPASPSPVASNPDNPPAPRPVSTEAATPELKPAAAPLPSPPALIDTRHVQRTVENPRDTAARSPVSTDPPVPARQARISEAVRQPLEALRSVAAVDPPEPRAAVLAFAARLTRLEAQKETTPVAAPEPASLPPVEPAALSAGSADAGAPDRELAPGQTVAPISAARVSPVATREAKSAEHPLQDAAAADTAVPSAAQSSNASTARREPANAPAEPHRTPAAQTPEPPPPVSPARDIRLQVTGGERRVEVRLTERAGEVQVSVRTPDSQLAGALRDDLPALSARLQQTGFRAETWHPAGVRTEHFASDSSPAGSAGYRQASGGGDRQHQHEPPPRRAPQPQRNADGAFSPQEFSRLFSSLQ